MTVLLSGPFAAGDNALQAFLEQGAAGYEAHRNFDYGPDDRSNV